MVPHLVRQHRRPVELLNCIEFPTGESDVRFDAVVALRASSLHAPAAPRTVRTHILNVDRCGDDLYVCEGKLRTLRDDATVECYHRAAIIVQPVAVTSLLVRVEVHTAKLHKQVNIMSENGMTAMVKP